MKRAVINKFNGGIADDTREHIDGTSAVAKHFDIYSNPYRLTPYLTQIADNKVGSDAAGLKSYDPRDFALGSDGVMYALCREVAANNTLIVKKTDPITDSTAWTIIASSFGGSDTRITGSFLEYKSYFWGFQGTNKIWKYDFAGNTFTGSVTTVGATITSVAQSVRNPKNDILYMFYNNIVVANNNGSITDNAFTGPSDMKIVSADMYGNYLAIAFSPKNTQESGRSVVLLWNCDTAQTLANESIDWGEGRIAVLGNIEGRLVGVSNKFLNQTYGNGNYAMVIRMYEGAFSNVIKEIKATGTNSFTIPNYKVILNNKLYWPAYVTNNQFGLAVWSFGRKNLQSPFAVNMDRLDANATQINTLGNAGNVFYMNINTDGSITKTEDTSNPAYSQTSTFDSLVNHGMPYEDMSRKKQLFGYSLLYSALPAAGEVVLKYRVDGGSYVTLLDRTTDNETFFESNVDSNGSKITSGRSFEFRIESTGGAEILEFAYNYDFITTLVK